MGTRRIFAALLLFLTLTAAGFAQVPDDALIVPGKRIGERQLGSLVKLFLALGEQNLKLGQKKLWSAESHGIRAAYGVSWPEKGVVAVVCTADTTQAVAIILLGYEGIGDDPRRFATAEGIRIGSSASEVHRSYGPPSATWVTPLGEPRWWYDRTGIFFDLLDSQAYALGVYTPKLCGQGHE